MSSYQRSEKWVKMSYDTLKSLPALRKEHAKDLKESVYYVDSKVSEQEPCSDLRPTVVFVNEDTLVATERLVKEGKKPLVLNMASDKCAGGGYKKGASAQEETLFYRTLYPLVIDNKVYPLKQLDAIYSPGVIVWRDVATYEPLNKKDCWTVDFVACPAVRNKGS